MIDFNLHTPVLKVVFKDSLLSYIVLSFGVVSSVPAMLFQGHIMCMHCSLECVLANENIHSAITIEHWAHVAGNIFDRKDLGRHLLL